MVNSSVTFCVGGSFFTTLFDTLSKEPSCRLYLLARGTLPCTKDSQGILFIDRDPKHFQLLLNFLRDGWCLLPPSSEERTELLQEVRYYLLGQMEAWIRSQELVHRPPSSSLSLAARLGSTTIYSNSPSALPSEGINPYSPGFTTRGGHPTLAYSGLSPSCRALFEDPHAPPPPPVPPPPPSQATSISRTLTESQAVASLGAVSTPYGARGAPGADFRAAFTHATFSSPSPAHHPSYTLPLPAPAPTYVHASQLLATNDTTTQALSQAPHNASSSSSSALAASATGKWTAKYLLSHGGLREVANTLMELGYLPMHRSLHGGKVEIKIACECSHHRTSSLLAPSSGIHAAAAQSSLALNVSVKSSSGWSFELDLRPGSTDLDLFRKYNIGEFVQENWFVLSAVLKDQFGVLMEESSGDRPGCSACKKVHLAVVLNKIY